MRSPEERAREIAGPCILKPICPDDIECIPCESARKFCRAIRESVEAERERIADLEAGLASLLDECAISGPTDLIDAARGLL